MLSLLQSVLTLVLFVYHVNALSSEEQKDLEAKWNTDVRLPRTA